MPTAPPTCSPKSRTPPELFERTPPMDRLVAPLPFGRCAVASERREVEPVEVLDEQLWVAVDPVVVDGTPGGVVRDGERRAHVGGELLTVGAGHDRIAIRPQHVRR